MKLIKEKAYAKINLDLEIIRKRSDGFHELRSILIPLDFYDELTFQISDKTVVNSNVDIEDNIILKAVNLFLNTYKIKEHVKVTLKKIIPIGAGLGGGSADAAATLRGLNKLFDLNLPKEQLHTLANQLGSDVLFCLYNQPAIITGRGDIIEFIEIPPIENILVLAMPFQILTKDIFKNHIITKIKTDFNKKLNHLVSGEIDKFITLSENQLLDTAIKTNKHFCEKYYQLIKISPNIKMTGSGPTLFILNPSNQELTALSKDNDIKVYKKKMKNCIYKLGKQ